MKVVRTADALRHWIKGAKRRGLDVGFVPTMGDLHAGHLALVRRACKENDRVVVSVFVNSIQFNDARDYRAYRRRPRRDQEVARAAGVDLFFSPSARWMYPDGFSTRVREEDLSTGLCGAYRPGHFEGVTTAVAKLFNLVQPDRAYFGEKDAQQAAVIKRMVRDLNFPVQIRVVGVVRDLDGLALSSRNARLSSGERNKAVRLRKALRAARRRIREGERRPQSISTGVRSALKGPGLRLEYVEIVDPRSLKKVDRVRGGVFIAACLWVGRTRLIDHIFARSR